MKKWLVYLLGVLTGLVLAFVLVLVLPSEQEDNNTEEQRNKDMTMFNEPGDIIEENSVQVFQVLSKDAALVTGEVDPAYDLYGDKVYLLTNDEGKYYYDDQIVKLPEGKVFKQIGIYRYPTKNEMIKTVPIITIMNK